MNPNSASSDRGNLSPTFAVVTSSVCLTVSTLCIAMRLYTKLLVTRAPGWEDLTCLLAWIGLIAYVVIAIQAIKYGCGTHIEQVAPSDLRKFAKIANAHQLTYAPLIFLTKLSILLLYLRVFAPKRRGKTFWSIQALIWLNLLFYLANFFLKIFQCIPREKIWNGSVPGHCISMNIPILVTSTINVVSDLLMLLLPIVCVWRLQMSTRRKIGTSAIFAAGTFACISSIMRLVVSVEKRNSTDQTYIWYPQILWTTAEITSGILASCFPALPTFFQKASKILLDMRTGSRSSNPNTWDKKPPLHTELSTISSTRHRYSPQLLRGGGGRGVGNATRFQHGHYTLSVTERDVLDYDNNDTVSILQGSWHTTTLVQGGGQKNGNISSTEQATHTPGDESTLIDNERHQHRHHQQQHQRYHNQGGILKIVEVNIESESGMGLGSGSGSGSGSGRGRRERRTESLID